MDIHELYLKKFTSSETGFDYVMWAISEVEKGLNNISSFELSSLGREANYFEALELFNVLLIQGFVSIPSQKECHLYNGMKICKSILLNKENLFKKAYELFDVCIELEYDSDLMDWYWISEDIDALKYDMNTSKLDYETIEADIIEKANKFLESYKSIYPN
ncbi:hypothetical protein EDC18_1199 [Natranaerovirga pectinivora]|uniref:Uncharacterized protein n=2 Tax=Natranaerovirga pectinivora TaxID=682400 RepID=A0A4R3MDJ1_9FIRM|nr:hypothetical protein EDC18_1199 [Natranaerovirga pectinivora]